MQKQVLITFDTEHEAGALLSWCQANLYEVKRNVREASKDRDTQFLANSRVEEAGLSKAIVALEKAGVNRFDGLETGPS